MTRPAKIDTHSHTIPPKYRQFLIDNGHSHPDGMPAIPQWSAEDHIASMDSLNISKSYLSVSSPGTHLVIGNDQLARQVTRSTNEEVAEAVRQNPDRFGFLASLPLPDVEGSLAEIDYALDVLKADGFCLLTNCNGVYLGDPKLDKVFEKLNERNAIIFMHPTQCCVPVGGTVTPVAPLPQYPRPMLEFFFDSTRAITNLILSGTVDRYQNIRFIVGHCGAMLPPVIERFCSFASKILVSDGPSITSDTVKHLFKTRFHFDLAGFPFPDQIHGLIRFTDSSRLLYGSDFPFTPAPSIAGVAEVMEKEIGGIFDESEIEAVYKNNAEKLFA